MSILGDRFVYEPESREIARRLNACSAMACEHGRSPCFLRCGVRMVFGKWVVIPQGERLSWLDEVEAILAEGP